MASIPLEAEASKGDDRSKVKFGAIPYAIIADSRLNPEAIRLAGAMLAFAVNLPYCTASNRSLGEFIGCSPSAAKRGVSLLEKAGHIRCEEVEQTTTNATGRVIILRWKEDRQDDPYYTEPECLKAIRGKRQAGLAQARQDETQAGQSGLVARVTNDPPPAHERPAPRVTNDPPPGSRMTHKGEASENAETPQTSGGRAATARSPEPGIEAGGARGTATASQAGPQLPVGDYSVPFGGLPDEIIASREIGPDSKIVLVALQLMSDEAGCCLATDREIAGRAGISRPDAVRSIAELVRTEFVAVEEGPDAARVLVLPEDLRFGSRFLSEIGA